jgi:hypothetical protein
VKPSPKKPTTPKKPSPKKKNHQTPAKKATVKRQEEIVDETEVIQVRQKKEVVEQKSPRRPQREAAQRHARGLGRHVHGAPLALILEESLQIIGQESVISWDDLRELW